VIADVACDTAISDDGDMIADRTGTSAVAERPHDAS